jgi:hypothetical protein
MPEGESRVMNRKFLDVDGVEIEVCINANGNILLGTIFTGGYIMDGKILIQSMIV